MTGNDIFKRSLNLLGYTPTEQEAVSSKALLTRMPDILNQILSDLGLSELTDLSQNIKATPIQLDAVCCGCTMLLALSDGDNTKNRIFTEIYNAKRAAALSKTGQRQDTLPYTCDGGI